MKKIFFLILLFPCLLNATTLEEDYAQMRPLMDMLSVQSGASINLLKPYVEKGNSVAQYFTGIIYEEGRVVTQNKQKAFEMYSMAADKNPLAMLKKADLMLQPDGPEYNVQEAVDIYKRLIKNPEVADKARQRLILVKQIIDNTARFELLEKNALQGDETSQVMLAQYAYESNNMIGAYVWFSILYQNTKDKEEQKEIENILNTLQGRMTLSQITQAEKEFLDIQQAIQPQQNQ